MIKKTLGICCLGWVLASADASLAQSTVESSAPLTVPQPPAVDSFTSEIELPQLDPGTPIASEEEVRLNLNSLISTWLKLAATGLSQIEIESYLQGSIGAASLEQTKSSLRGLVLARLRPILSTEPRDSLALNLARELALSEMSAVGLELDYELQATIERRLGFNL